MLSTYKETLHFMLCVGKYFVHLNSVYSLRLVMYYLKASFSTINQTETFISLKSSTNEKSLLCSLSYV